MEWWCVQQQRGCRYDHTLTHTRLANAGETWSTEWSSFPAPKARETAAGGADSAPSGRAGMAIRGRWPRTDARQRFRSGSVYGKQCQPGHSASERQWVRQQDLALRLRQLGAGCGGGELTGWASQQGPNGFGRGLAGLSGTRGSMVLDYRRGWHFIISGACWNPRHEIGADASSFG